MSWECRFTSISHYGERSVHRVCFISMITSERSALLILARLDVHMPFPSSADVTLQSWANMNRLAQWLKCERVLSSYNEHQIHSRIESKFKSTERFAIITGGSKPEILLHKELALITVDRCCTPAGLFLSALDGQWSGITALESTLDMIKSSMLLNALGNRL